MADGGFGDRLASRVASRRSQIVLGLDPDPARLWPRALELAGGESGPGGEIAPDGDAHLGGEARLDAEAGFGRPAGRGWQTAPATERAARAVAAHCRLVLEAAGSECVAVKPQVACFERLGAPGWAALAHTIADARRRGLMVIADAKRGDIDISARAYGQAFFGGTPTPFGRIPSLGVDALTVNPLLGRDALEPLVEAARGTGCGVLALVRTSNPGAADIQDQELKAGGSVSDLLARMVDELGRPGIGHSGLADVGAVTGATVPERLEALRAAMPHAVLLLPGIGAQGASGRELAPAFVPGPAGGLVSASRGIVYAHERAAGPGGQAREADSDPAEPGGDPAVAARREASRLRELVWDLYA